MIYALHAIPVIYCLMANAWRHAHQVTMQSMANVRNVMLNVKSVQVILIIVLNVNRVTIFHKVIV